MAVEAKLQPLIEVASMRQASGSTLRREWILIINFATVALFLLFGLRLLSNLSNPVWFAFILIWLFGMILLSAFAFVRHTESLTVILVESSGTLVALHAVRLFE